MNEFRECYDDYVMRNSVVIHLSTLYTTMTCRFWPFKTEARFWENLQRSDHRSVTLWNSAWWKRTNMFGWGRPPSSWSHCKSITLVHVRILAVKHSFSTEHTNRHLTAIMSGKTTTTTTTSKPATPSTSGGRPHHGFAGGIYINVGGAGYGGR